MEDIYLDYSKLCQSNVRYSSKDYAWVDSILTFSDLEQPQITNSNPTQTFIMNANRLNRYLLRNTPKH